MGKNYEPKKEKGKLITEIEEIGSDYWKGKVYVGDSAIKVEVKSLSALIERFG